jgi:MFS transporter, ACS family, tartrate transporter
LKWLCEAAALAAPDAADGCLAARERAVAHPGYRPLLAFSPAVALVTSLTTVSSTADRARLRIAMHVLPLVFVMYIVNYLDRANVSFANRPMSQELHFSQGVYGRGAGIFFVGYLAFEIPGALIVERYGARRWMARILFSWGLCAAGTGLIGLSPAFNRLMSVPMQFYAARLLLGLAEAGFYPGIIVYMTHWFAPADRARGMSTLVMAIPVALGLGAILSAAVLQLHWLNLAGWRWLFILEGLPAVVLGFVAWFFMTDRPSKAHWLAADEREWIEQALEAERRGKRATAHVTVLQSFRHPNVILLALALFFGNLNSYYFIFWLPKLIENASGLSVGWTTVLCGVPYGTAFVATALVAWLSDRSGRRKFYTIMPLCVTAAAFTASAIPGQPFWLVLVWLSLAGAGIYAASPSYWVLATATLQAAAAAASIGMINSIGNFSGFVAPEIAGKLLDNGFSNAQLVPYFACCALVDAVLVALLRLPHARQASWEPAADPSANHALS